jgi:hypothetical protein
MVLHTLLLESCSEHRNEVLLEVWPQDGIPNFVPQFPNVRKVRRGEKNSFALDFPLGLPLRFIFTVPTGKDSYFLICKFISQIQQMEKPFAFEK